MRLAYEYSDKEVRLFEKLGLSMSLQNPNISPVTLYTTATYNAFMNDTLDKKVIDSLKRCINAIIGASTRETQKPIFRLTPEFDALIDL